MKMWKLQLLVWIVSTAKLFHKKDSLETELSIAQSISKHIDILVFNHVKFNVPPQQQSLNQLIKLSWLPLSKSARSEKIAKIVIWIINELLKLSKLTNKLLKLLKLSEFIKMYLKSLNLTHKVSPTGVKKLSRCK